MKNRRNRPFDLLAAGELLIDFISVDFAEDLEKAHHFKRLLGGSPANMCMNMTRLGNRTLLAATVGEDDMGKWLYREVEALGVDCRLLRRVGQPTTLILVTRSRAVSNFEAYRSADCEITTGQFPDDLLQEVRIFHTTCFGLSRQPAREAILDAAARAADMGCQLSMDANYAAKIWPDREEARRVVARYCELGALLKVSEVDWERLYGSPLTEAEEVARHLLGLGAREVCVTLGEKGAYVASAGGDSAFLPARPVKVRDTTGAGDAFWSGYLTAWLDGHGPEGCVRAGRRMAEMKLEHFGPLGRRVGRSTLYEEEQG